MVVVAVAAVGLLSWWWRRRSFVVVAVAFFSIRIGVAEEEEHAAGVAVFEDVEIERRFCDFSFRERRRREEERRRGE